MEVTYAQELYEKVLMLKSCVVSISTSDEYSGIGYEALRAELMAVPSIGPRLPTGVRTCRTANELWGYIKPLFGRYEERREFWRKEFCELLDDLEGWDRSPSIASAELILGSVDLPHVSELWRKALERRKGDPEGALTAARSLVESTCKHVLDEAGEAYDDKGDLRQLYRQTAKRLRLAPDQHSEQVFKQILQGCQSVVEGLATMRSVLGDAHGKGNRAVKPLPIHAELGVNLAGTMSTFLLETWELRKKTKAGAS